jgi:hypothetical protein
MPMISISLRAFVRPAMLKAKMRICCSMEGRTCQALTGTERANSVQDKRRQVERENLSKCSSRTGFASGW